VKRMVRDLNFPVTICCGATLREPDGLAMSSRTAIFHLRNVGQALAFGKPIQIAGVRSAPTATGAPLRRCETNWPADRSARGGEGGLHSFFRSNELKTSPRCETRNATALAVFVGQTRLIDNAKL